MANVVSEIDITLPVAYTMKDGKLIEHGVMRLPTCEDILAIKADRRFNELTKTRIEFSNMNPATAIEAESILIMLMSIMLPRLIRFKFGDETLQITDDDIRKMHHINVQYLSEMKEDMETKAADAIKIDSDKKETGDAPKEAPKDGGTF